MKPIYISPAAEVAEYSASSMLCSSGNPFQTVPIDGPDTYFFDEDE